MCCLCPNYPKNYKFLINLQLNIRRGCSAVVARSLCMWKAPGSIPGISKMDFFSTFQMSICAPNSSNLPSQDEQFWCPFGRSWGSLHQCRACFDLRSIALQWTVWLYRPEMIRIKNEKRYEISFFFLLYPVQFHRVVCHEWNQVKAFHIVLVRFKPVFDQKQIKKELILYEYYHR